VDEKRHLATDVPIDRNVDGIQTLCRHDEPAQIRRERLTIPQPGNVIERTRDVPVDRKDSEAVAVFFNELARHDRGLTEISTIGRDHQAAICFERPGKRPVRSNGIRADADEVHKVVIFIHPLSLSAEQDGVDVYHFRPVPRGGS